MHNSLKGLIAGVFVISLSMTACAEKTTDLDNDSNIASYGVGYNIGKSLQAQELSGLNLDALVLGLKDALGNKELRVTEEKLSQAFTHLQEQEAKEFEAKAQTNLKASEAFLLENGKKKDVKTSASGLQYEIIKEGTGAKPTADSMVVVHYKGTLADGTEFDSSYARNKPAEFAVNSVIPGWTEALQMMPVGSKWKLYVPPKLAYGEQSPSPAIPPNAVLIFEVELLDIKK